MSFRNTQSVNTGTTSGSALSHHSDPTIQQPLHHLRRGAPDGWHSRGPKILPPSVIPGGSVNFGHSASSQLPLPRQGQTVSNPTPDGNLYIFGGRNSSGIHLNDIWLYSTKDNTATPLLCHGDLPTPRAWSSISVTDNLLIVWGGGSYDDHHDDNLYQLDLISYRWLKVNVHGQSPSGRKQHAFATVGSTLYVYGGHETLESPPLNDIWSFDLNTLKTQPTWKLIEPSSQDQPPPRQGHQWVLHHNQLITFGGFNPTGPQPQRYLNDVWSLDLRTSSWTELQYTGQTPSARISYAATVVGDMIYVFGGWERKRLGDLAIFNISTRRWFKFDPTGPSPRCDPSMVSVGSLIYVFGGGSHVGANDSELVYVLDTASVREPIDMGGGTETMSTLIGSSIVPMEATDQTFSALIRIQGGKSQGGLYSKFLLEGVHDDPDTEVEEAWAFSINTDIAVTYFHSRGADEHPPNRLLHGTYQRVEQFSGFDGFRGSIGNGRFHLRTNSGIVVKGEIVGGPQRGQSFAGTGTWYKA